MIILVCIKQVPDTASKFKVADNDVWYDTADLAWRMNDYDEYAVEQAIQLKEQVKETDITVLSIGPARVQKSIKKALAMGCDRGAYLADDDAAGKEPFEIAGIIAEQARDKGFDLIFTGMQSQDRGSAQVGVLVGEMLSIPVVTTVVDFSYSDSRIEVKRELEGGPRAKVTLKTHALVTCQLGLNTPRYPTFSSIMKAKKNELLTVSVRDLNNVKAGQKTAKLYFPVKKAGATVLEGDPGDLAEQLIQILKAKTGVLAQEKGRNPESYVMRKEIVPADEKSAGALNIEIGEQLVQLTTLRSVDGIALTYHDAYLPAKHFPTLVDAAVESLGLEKPHVWQMIEKMGFTMANIVERLKAQAASETIAGPLKVDVGSPIFYGERVLYSEEGTPLKYAECYNRGDLYSLSVVLVK